ncbi:hypothetical protein ZIOFF_071532 [Zingiber officinale]|uniref:Uncharacterized protein n=1 Tax=Zingiber officinale TaxID=94328 RepID=A0A8J5EUG9_ZINOF|nr:hypothetical protein ZIOFF_071532 [Zingiber officinale]
MDDYAREMMDLKTLVACTLENKGGFAKIRLRASVFEAIEEDKILVNEDDVPPALLGSCNNQAKQLHVFPSDFLLMLELKEKYQNEQKWNARKPLSSAAPGGLHSLSRLVPRNLSSDRKSSFSIPISRKNDYMWKSDDDDVSDALENIQLDRKARNLTSSWRHSTDGIIDNNGTADHR